MAISDWLDAHEPVVGLDRVAGGAGLYVLYAGRAVDSNIVYIGKSRTDVLVRIARHQEDGKEFDRVGVVLPERVDAVFVHNLEHYVLAEYQEKYGELPPFNNNDAHLLAGGPRFNWHRIPRRPDDAAFIAANDSGFRRCVARLKLGRQYGFSQREHLQNSRRCDHRAQPGRRFCGMHFNWRAGTFD